MTEQARVADIILGFEGLAILRAWMLDNAAVQARTQEILDIAARIEEEPWSNQLTYGESTITAGYAEWSETYDDPGNPMLLAEEPVVQEILAQLPGWHCARRGLRHRETHKVLGLIGPPSDRH